MLGAYSGRFLKPLCPRSNWPPHTIQSQEFTLSAHGRLFKWALIRVDFFVPEIGSQALIWVGAYSNEYGIRLRVGMGRGGGGGGGGVVALSPYIGPKCMNGSVWNIRMKLDFIVLTTFHFHRRAQTKSINK